MSNHKIFKVNPFLEEKSRANGFSPIDLGFIFGLNVPVMIIHFYLKWIRIGMYGEVEHIFEVFEIFKSDLLFHCAYIMLVFSVLGLCRRIKVKAIAFLAIQLITVVISLLEFCAHNYYVLTGSMLNYDLLEYVIKNISELRLILSSEGNLPMVVIFLFSLFAVLLSPWMIGYWIVIYGKGGKLFKWFRLLPRKKSVFVALGIMTFVLIFSPALTNKNILFTQNLTFNLVNTYYENHFLSKENSLDEWSQTREAFLEHYLAAAQKNLVIIVLESTRSDATSVYNSDLKTTPFLKSLSKKSLVVEKAFSVVPHTSKSLISIHCGIEPKVTTEIEEANEKGIPLKCLPELLSDIGYRTAFFQTATEHFENRRSLVANMGHNEFYPGNRLPKGRYQRTNYFGYEDRILLAPSKKWHKKRLKRYPDKPFMVTYLTNTTHHNYSLPSTHQYKWFHSNDYYNQYLNTVNYVDSFLADLIRQYKSLGLYKNTVFIFMGDHGEGFREHNIRGHSNIVYREGIQVPLIVHDPSRFLVGLKVSRITFQPDILPTAVDLLGFRLVGSSHRGLSLFTKEEGRRIYASCWNQNTCVSRYGHNLKYIHFFGKRPDEFYDLRNDELEKRNILLEISPELHSEWKRKTLKWYKDNRQFYDTYRSQELTSKTQKNEINGPL